jgi:polyisoprenoid-binding protein YceI
MQKPFLLFSFVLSFSLLACNNNEAEADKALVSEKKQVNQEQGNEFSIDSSASGVRFTGYGVGKEHPGNFKLSSGKVIVADSVVTGGSFEIDIRSMQIEQQGEMFQNKLKPHLLGPDFFDSEKYPKAKFEITEVRTYQSKASDTSVVKDANYFVSGNFTLKDQTRNISFPARIDVKNDKVRAVANFNIDRTQWNIRYHSDKSLGDQFISETVNVQLNLVANPNEL